MASQGSSGFGWQESLTIMPVGKFYGLLIVVKISEIQIGQDVPRKNSGPGKLQGLLPFSAIKDTICLKARLAQMSFQRLGLFTETWRQK